MSEAKGQPAAIVPATTQTPKATIPADIRNESTVSMIGPLFRAQTIKCAVQSRADGGTITGRAKSAPEFQSRRERALHRKGIMVLRMIAAALAGLSFTSLRAFETGIETS